jgi:hypothetical protein
MIEVGNFLENETDLMVTDLMVTYGCGLSI